MTDGNQEDDEDLLEDLIGPSERDDTTCVWLGLEIMVPDKSDQHDPKEMESDLREWFATFLKEGLQNIDFHETGEGVDLFPREAGWEENPLYVRYKKENWWDNPESMTGRIRNFTVWFPVQDFMEHHELNALKSKAHYLIGDELYKKYEEEIDVRGVIIAGSEDTVRDHVRDMYPDVEFDDHLE